MKIVALIPYWLDYHPDHKSHKNLKKIGGHYLINHSIKLLSQIDSIETTYIYASNKKVLDYIDDTLNFGYLKRPAHLDSNDVTIEDIIDEFLGDIKADIIVLLHPNSPFLQKSTVSDCIEKVVSGNNDSAFTACEYRKLAWFQGKPLNYSLSKPTPKPSEVLPIMLEQASLYIFSVASFKANRARIGSNPYIKCINHFEGHEINIEEDFNVAELIVNSGMYMEL